MVMATPTMPRLAPMVHPSPPILILMGPATHHRAGGTMIQITATRGKWSRPKGFLMVPAVNDAANLRSPFYEWV